MAKRKSGGSDTLTTLAVAGGVALVAVVGYALFTSIADAKATEEAEQAGESFVDGAKNGATRWLDEAFNKGGDGKILGIF